MKELALPLSRIESCIMEIRGHKVMLDSDLAELYGVDTKVLNRAVKRNLERFPADFMFQLTTEELANLRFHFGASRWGGRRYLPYVFTEHGAIMAASVLNSPQAVEISVFVVRAFVRLREMAITHKELAHKLDELERKVVGHDQAIAGLIDAIRQLMTPPPAKKQRIGFEAPEKRK